MKDRRNEYGSFYLVQMPSNATTDYVAGTLSKCQSRFNVDLCILDSIHLLNPKKHRQSEYSELGDMLREIKNVIVSHNKGRGVPLISPWHTNRKSWEDAKQSIPYTLSALAKSADAERFADVIVTILRENGLENQLRGSMIKGRDGGELPEFFLTCDFRQGYVGDNLAAEVDPEDIFMDLGIN
jgi:hypothetical protein